MFKLLYKPVDLIAGMVAAEGTRRLTGIWPGDEGEQPEQSA